MALAFWRRELDSMVLIGTLLLCYIIVYYIILYVWWLNGYIYIYLSIYISDLFWSEKLSTGNGWLCPHFMFLPNTCQNWDGCVGFHNVVQHQTVCCFSWYISARLVLIPLKTCWSLSKFSHEQHSMNQSNCSGQDASTHCDPRYPRVCEPVGENIPNSVFKIATRRTETRKPEPDSRINHDVFHWFQEISGNHLKPSETVSKIHQNEQIHVRGQSGSPWRHSWTKHRAGTLAKWGGLKPRKMEK